MKLNELRNHLVPPSNPVETGKPEDWGKIESAFKTRLPNDFKSFINIYGSGMIGDYIVIWNPFSSGKYINFIQQSKAVLDDMRRAKVRFKQERDQTHPIYPLFPEPNGALPFGSTVSGHLFLWKTKGNPSDWTVILQHNRSPEYEDHPYNLTEFLLLLINDKLSNSIIDDEEIAKWEFRSRYNG